MLRLLFTTKDLSKQMTVITDGIDSQMNVFVTENTNETTGRTGTLVVTQEGSAVVKQSEGTKQITITLSQAAGTSA